jgi:PAS domain S-box-containing protein
MAELPPGLVLELLDALPDAVVVADDGGVVRLVNRQAEVLFGYERGDLIGEHIERLVPDDHRDHHPALQRSYLANPVTRPMGAGRELSARRRDGTTFPAEISLSAIGTDQGRFVSAAVRDVTARKQAEAEVRDLLDAAPDAVVVVDGDGVIRRVNRQTEALFGYAREDLVGQQVEMLVPDTVKAAHPRLRTTYAASPLTRPMGQGMELAARRRDGSTFPAEISLSAVNGADGVLVSAAIRDVTTRKAAERAQADLRAQLDQSQRQRLESLGHLAGGVAHDFNNLLGVILNYTGFVGEAIADSMATGGQPLHTEVLDDIEEVQRAAERAARLTHQLLAFARREVTRPRVLDLNAVVDDINRLLARTLGEHVELRTRPSRRLWSIHADSGQLEQVLMNLAVNARDAMPTGGQLTISTENVVVGEGGGVADGPTLPSGRWVRLRVTDTGGGMPPEVVAQAFEPFFTTKQEGTGLGLSTVFGIVEQSGGRVTIDSTPGAGTVISTYFPAVSALAVAEGEEAVPGSGTNLGETILLCEDEPAVRELTRRVLTRNGYHVLTTPNGDDALAILRSHDGRIDLLLTDVVMPRMLGKELVRRAQEIKPDIHVLYMSGYARAVITPEDTLDPNLALIEKPFTERSLLAKVRDVLEGKQH